MSITRAVFLFFKNIASTNINPNHDYLAMIGLFNPDLEFPGTGDEIISRSGKVLERADFEKMKDEYYSFRGWDVETGLQNKDRLNDLKLSFVMDELEKKGFMK